MKVDRVTLINGALFLELLAFGLFAYAVTHWIPEEKPYYADTEIEVYQASR